MSNLCLRYFIFGIVASIVLMTTTSCQKNEETNTRKLDIQKTHVDQAVPEKIFDDATLKVWKDRLKNFEPEDKASESLIPGLLEIVQDQTLEWHIRKTAALALARLGEPAKEKTLPLLLRLSNHKENSKETQIWAGKAISKFGSEAASATPELRERLLRQEGALIVRLTFIDALSRIGTHHPLAIPTLIEVLQKSNGSGLENVALREASLLGLMSIGPAAAPATLALITALSDSHESVRSKAAMTLEKTGPLAASASAPLAEMIILEESLEARNNAAKALTSMGPNALPLIEQFLKDEDVLVRRSISKAVVENQNLLPKLQKTIAENLNDSDDEVRLNSTKALIADTTYQSKDVLLNAIVPLLESKSRSIRVQAIDLLVQLPIKNDQKIQKIDGLRDHPKREIRSAYKEALKRLNP